MNTDFEVVQKALEESEKKYRTSFEYSGTGMMLIDEDMTIALMNQRLVDFSGYTKEEVEGKRKWVEFIHEDDRQMMLDYSKRREQEDADSPPPSEYEFRYRHKNGQVRYMLANVGMIPGTKQRLVSLVDISERKQMEQALRRSERRYHDLFENANDIIYTHDVDGNFISVNATGERVYGYRRDEIKDLHIRDVVDAAYQPIVAEKIQKRIQGTGSSEPFEVLTYSKDRKPIWLDVNMRLALDDVGRMRVEGIARDITLRKRQEKELSERRQEISDVADYMPAIICESDLTLRVTSTNKQGLITFGYTDEELEKGLYILDLVHPDDRESLLKDVENIKNGDYGNFVEHCFLRKDGSCVHLIVNSIPLLKDGEMVGLRSYLVDVTDRRKAEQRLQASEQRFRSIFSASPIGISLFDTTGKLQSMNQSFRNMFAIPDQAETADINFAIDDVIPDAGRIRKQLDSGESIQLETDSDLKVLKEGESYGIAKIGTRYLQWNLTAVSGMQDSGNGFMLAQVQDITERRKVEEAKLQKAHDEAEIAKQELDGLRRQMGQSNCFYNMVSQSEQMHRIFDILPQMAQASTTVLVTGESGTGKELIARSLHELSPRKDKAFIAINCSALPDNLLESELFGYKAGAFTDAKKDKPGKFALADNGTIFLDEIGDISPAMQAKLLRVLQQKTFEPLGDTKTVQVDVRIVAATNRDLPKMVKEGSFREDLFYRIKVLNIALPPLRDRRRDIPALCDHFIESFNKRYNKNVKEASSKALDALLAYNYPGNIRELENIIEHAFIFCQGDTIEPQHLPPEVATLEGGSKIADPFADINDFADLERMYLKKVISESGSKLAAARKLGIHKATLFRKLKSLGMA